MKSIAIISGLFAATLLLFGISFAVPAALAKQPSAHRSDAQPVISPPHSEQVSLEIDSIGIIPDIPTLAAHNPPVVGFDSPTSQTHSGFSAAFDPIDPGRVG